MAKTDTQDGFIAALIRLRQAQKSGKGAPPSSLYVNRPQGRVFAAAAYQIGLTPNQVTYISATFTIVGLLVLALAPATRPLTGTVRAGKTARGVYVFTVPKNKRSPITVTVSIKDAPVLVFTGDAD